MSIWGSIGKIALQAAPYVAAPFTGGASLYAAPLTQKLGQSWSAHDNAARAEKGLGPSSFDNILNQASGYAGLASSMGAPGLSGGKYAPPNARTAGGGNSGGIAGSIGPMIEQIMAARGNQTNQQPSLANSNGTPAGAMNFAGAGQSQGGQTGRYDGLMRGLGPVMGRRDQNVPNLAESIGAGRQDAIRNQPWRNGYDVISRGPEPADDSQGNIGPTIRTPMPPIYPNTRRRYSSAN